VARIDFFNGGDNDGGNADLSEIVGADTLIPEIVITFFPACGITQQVSWTFELQTLGNIGNRIL